MPSLNRVVLLKVVFVFRSFYSRSKAVLSTSFTIRSGIVGKGRRTASEAL